MKTILKTTGFLLFAFAVNTCFAQSSTGSSPQLKKDQTTTQAKKGKKQKATDNKIAVSDQARPSDKSNAKAKSPISNK